jgi:hypothetical protein
MWLPLIMLMFGPDGSTPVILNQTNAGNATKELRDLASDFSPHDDPGRKSQ